MFEDKIKAYVNKISELKENILTEEATKTSLIMPFFAMLGYDVFNPVEFVPEFVADVGIKKHEKVDYAIRLNGEPIILIEAKSINEKLEKHDSQLFRYFATSKVKFAILTNGIVYKFFTDLDAPNIMDGTPFLTVDLLDLRDSDISELKKFQKDAFDVSNIINTASDLKYCGIVKQFLKDEFSNPSDDMVRFVANKRLYDGRFTQPVVDRFKPIVKKAISQYISDLVNDKIKSALTIQEAEVAEGEIIDTPITDDNTDSIVTTEEELQAFYIIKSLLGNTTELSRITYKDTLSYFAVLVDGKVTRWICRIYFKENIKYIVIPKDGSNIKYTVETSDDIYKLSKPLKDRLLQLL